MNILKEKRREYIKMVSNLRESDKNLEECNVFVSFNII